MWSRSELTKGRVRGALVGLFCATIVGTAALYGCGEQTKEGDSTATRAEVALPASAENAVASKPATVETSPGAPLARSAEEQEGLPPDVHVSVVDTLVTPGQSIGLVVETTSDVTRIALSDGNGDPLAFVKDAGTNLWRATYRVPLKPVHERWGLSVTARNEANRWRRVWVFVHTADWSPEAESLGDTDAEEGC